MLPWCSYIFWYKKLIEKLYQGHYGLTVIFLFKDSMKFSLKVHAFFSVLQVFKKFKSWIIWFDLYCPFRKHWSILSKGHIGNSDQDKIQFEPYCPSRILNKFPSKALFCYLKYSWKILIRNNMDWPILSV